LETACVGSIANALVQEPSVGSREGFPYLLKRMEAEIADSACLPTFSIVLPTYNRAHLLGRAVRGALAQTFRDFELIVVDDASTDATREVVKSFEDDRIVYIRREVNGGASATRNTGIRQARGRYIAFLDDDDASLPRFLEEIYRAFESAPEQVGFVWCGIQDIQDTGKGEVVRREHVWPRFDHGDKKRAVVRLFRDIPATSHLAVRKSCFETIGLFDERLRVAVDLDLVIRLARHFDFETVPEALVKYHRHAGLQLTDPNLHRAEAYQRIIEKHLDFMRECPSLWTAIYQKAGRYYYQMGDRAQGHRYMLMALRKSPFYGRLWVRMLVLRAFGSESPGLRRKILRFAERWQE
jgi:glycosyltransferase involved in cell wall biosynthesis